MSGVKDPFEILADEITLIRRQIDQRQNIRGFFVERLAGFGQFHALDRTDEQLRAEAFFQLLDLARERRLRDIQRNRCPADAELLRNRNKISEVA